MVLAFPVASACLISVVDFLTKDIFLRSVEAVPWLFCKCVKSFCLSFSVSESLSDDVFTPAALSCSIRVLVGFLSSFANSATVVLDIWCIPSHDRYS